MVFLFLLSFSPILLFELLKLLKSNLYGILLFTIRLELGVRFKLLTLKIRIIIKI